ncbi:FAD:protein FMN transferase [Tropicimonas marinistellae]|uniref:FAD:protein FMN transferase n=1 Tax=Tropicimonas marinistellae TaxID=1739787 RepID=UPI000829C4AB|nr:FAD:protein FMN transferase [Tropicimonas marinistellae]
MRNHLSRRRFLAIAASAMASPALAGSQSAHWQGTALGAGASMRLEGVAHGRAASVFSAVEAELRRLEGIFSIHDAGSSLARLNRDGRLDHPPAEMLELLGLAGRINDVTDGAFDPTVQPLWVLHAQSAAVGRLPARVDVSDAIRRTGWEKLRFDTRQIVFSRPGMAMTLNGIAQGYITDRIAAHLQAQGLTDVLIDMGEIAARGARPDGSAWIAGVARPDGRIVQRVRLKDRALATSAPTGTLLDARGEVGHIIDPANGLPVARHQLVSVSAGQAALADGLSTACCLLPINDALRAIAAFPTAKLESMI